MSICVIRKPEKKIEPNSPIKGVGWLARVGISMSRIAASPLIPDMIIILRLKSFAFERLR